VSLHDPDRLYALLPAVYRLRDATGGEPLRALLQVIAEQVQVVEDDIAQLYENWFVETCEEWVVPYIGDLVGYRLPRALGELGAATEDEVRRRLGISFPRRAIADAIGERRRRGTVGLLSDLGPDHAGWPTYAVESFPLLALDQHVAHLRPGRARTLDLRDGAALSRLATPFEAGAARTAAIGRPRSRHTRSRWNLPNVALFAWRLRSQSLTLAPAFCLDRSRSLYTFSILGNSAPLMIMPGPSARGPVVDDTDMPGFIGRRQLDVSTAELYGAGKSLRIYCEADQRPVGVERIVVADLSDWGFLPPRDQVAVDPVTGRIAFPPRHAPDGGVWVTYHHGLPDDIGGGEYPRGLRPVGARAHYRVGAGGDFQRITDAVERWREDRTADPAMADAVIELLDGATYQEVLDISLEAGDRLELRAADGVRPIIRLLDWYSNRPDQMRIRGPAGESGEGGYAGDTSAPSYGDADDADGNDNGEVAPCPPPPPRLTLDGLLIAGRSLELVGQLGDVHLRHCTLVPGWSLEHDCEPAHPDEPSIELDDTTARLRIEHSIVGALRVNSSEVTTDPVTIAVADSVVDCGHADGTAIAAPQERHAHAILTLLRCTIFGAVAAHAIELAENTIFAGTVAIARRQVGCVRFCSVPDGSRTPRRYSCQPDLARAEALARATARGVPAPDAELQAEIASARVRPRFDTTRYGEPAYARLALFGPEEIARGASDESEMGVYHDLFQPQRLDNLQAALDDCTPAAMDAGIWFAT
jgi:hypothetical protein